MKRYKALLTVLMTAFAAPGLIANAAPPAGAAMQTGAAKLPYVYTNWKQFTVADGLPNDHIFAVKVDGPRVWVGTEDGLALIDKPTAKVVRTWQEKDGLPFKVVTAIEVDKKTGDVWLGLFGGGLARLSGGRCPWSRAACRKPTRPWLSSQPAEDLVQSVFRYSMRSLSWSFVMSFV